MVTVALALACVFVGWHGRGRFYRWKYQRRIDEYARRMGMDL